MFTEQIKESGGAYSMQDRIKCFVDSELLVDVGGP